MTKKDEEHNFSSCCFIVSNNNIWTLNGNNYVFEYKRSTWQCSSRNLFYAEMFSFSVVLLMQELQYVNERLKFCAWKENVHGNNKRRKKGYLSQESVLPFLPWGVRGALLFAASSCKVEISRGKETNHHVLWR